MLVAVAAIVGLGRLGTELLPPADPRQFGVRMVGPPGQRVESTAETAATVEAILEEAAGGRRYTGVRLKLGGTYAPQVWDLEEGFGAVEGEAAVYVGLGETERVVLAARASLQGSLRLPPEWDPWWFTIEVRTADGRVQPPVRPRPRDGVFAVHHDLRLNSKNCRGRGGGGLRTAASRMWPSGSSRRCGGAADGVSRCSGAGCGPGRAGL